MAMRGTSLPAGRCCLIPFSPFHAMISLDSVSGRGNNSKASINQPVRISHVSLLTMRIPFNDIAPHMIVAVVFPIHVDWITDQGWLAGIFTYLRHYLWKKTIQYTLQIRISRLSWFILQFQPTKSAHAPPPVWIPLLSWGAIPVAGIITILL